MILTRKSKTFADYANNIFIPRVFLELEKTQRIDLVWDVGSYIKRTVLNYQLEQIEVQELANEYLAMENFQETGNISCKMMTIKRNS